MPNTKIKSYSYAVILSASSWLKQQESVWLLNVQTHPFRSAEFPSSPPFRVQTRKEGTALPLAAALGAVRGAEKRLPGHGRVVLANYTCSLHRSDIKQPFKHICLRDNALKITVP